MSLYKRWSVVIMCLGITYSFSVGLLLFSWCVVVTQLVSGFLLERTAPMCQCRFDVSPGRAGFRYLLFRHLGLQPPISIDPAKLHKFWLSHHRTFSDKSLIPGFLVLDLSPVTSALPGEEEAHWATWVSGRTALDIWRLWGPRGSVPPILFAVPKPVQWWLGHPISYPPLRADFLGNSEWGR